MKLSIIIPMIPSDTDKLYKVYSRIDCVLNTFDYEVIVVSDGVIDFDTVLEGNTIKEKFKFIINDEPIGSFECRRKGVKEATGDIVWFVDITDMIEDFDAEKIYTEYDMIVHNISYTTDGMSYKTIAPYQISESTSEVSEFTDLNPITSKYVFKLFLSNYIGNIIFNKKFIEKIYDKLPEIKNFNRFSNLYLNAAALKYVKSIKYNDKLIYTYFFKNEYTDVDDSNSNSYLFELDAKQIFSEKRVKEFVKLLDNDTVKVKKDIEKYIDLLLTHNYQEHDEDDHE